MYNRRKRGDIRPLSCFVDTVTSKGEIVTELTIGAGISKFTVDDLETTEIELSNRLPTALEFTVIVQNIQCLLSVVKNTRLYSRIKKLHEILSAYQIQISIEEGFSTSNMEETLSETKRELYGKPSEDFVATYMKQFLNSYCIHTDNNNLVLTNK